MLSIYVGNLAESVCKEELQSLFEQHGPIDRINIVADRDSGQPRGFAFVDMVNEDDARAAIQALEGHEVGGQAVKLSIAHSQTRAGRAPAGRQSTGRPPPRQRSAVTEIYVGNIPRTVGEAELQSLFEQHGRVGGVSLIKDRETGVSRGFAFVEMPDDEERRAAIDALHEHDLQDRRLTVRQAKPPAKPRGKRPPRRYPNRSEE
ncbi:MAG: hypothetical protein V3W34_04535 [Phycisphaerae bacterium]